MVWDLEAYLHTLLMQKVTKLQKHLGEFFPTSKVFWAPPQKLAGFSLLMSGCQLTCSCSECYSGRYNSYISSITSIRRTEWRKVKVTGTWLYSCCHKMILRAKNSQKSDVWRQWSAYFWDGRDIKGDITCSAEQFCLIVPINKMQPKRCFQHEMEKSAQFHLKQNERSNLKKADAAC